MKYMTVLFMLAAAVVAAPTAVSHNCKSDEHLTQRTCDAPMTLANTVLAMHSVATRNTATGFAKQFCAENPDNFKCANSFDF